MTDKTEAFMQILSSSPAGANDFEKQVACSITFIRHNDISG